MARRFDTVEPLELSATAPIQPEIVLYDALAQNGDVRIVSSDSPVYTACLGQLGLGLVNTALLYRSESESN